MKLKIKNKSLFLVSFLMTFGVVQQEASTIEISSDRFKRVSHTEVNTALKYNKSKSTSFDDIYERITANKIEVDMSTLRKNFDSKYDAEVDTKEAQFVNATPKQLNKIIKLEQEDKRNYKLHRQLAERDAIKENTAEEVKRIKAKILFTDKLSKVDYWQTVHSIESKQGKFMYRPKNKDKNCTHTKGPCGHYQINVQALKDIGCTSIQCRKDRLDYKKSLEFSKKLLVLNEKRLKKHGITKLEDYQKYLIHQQGANGIKSIIAATKGKKVLSKTNKKNMANNSPYSYKQYKKMGSKVAANTFMNHWESKWDKERRSIALAEMKAPADNFINVSAKVPTFNHNEINIALNTRF